MLPKSTGSDPGGVKGAKPPSILDTNTERDTFANYNAAFLRANPRLCNRANRMEACGTLVKGTVSDCDCVRHVPVHERKLKVSHNWCGVNGCQRCRKHVTKERGDKTAKRALAMMANAPSRKGYRKGWHHIVLTMRSGLEAGETLNPSTLSRNFHRIFRSWKRMWRHMRTWNGHVRGDIKSNWKYLKRQGKLLRLSPECGAIAAVEVGGRGAVHLHVLTWGWPHIDATTLRNTWKMVSGSHQCHVQPVRKIRGGIAELIKYVSKPPHHGQIAPFLTPLVTDALCAMHRVRLYGVARVKVPHHYGCPVCGSLSTLQTDWLEDEGEIYEALKEARAPPLPYEQRIRRTPGCADLELQKYQLAHPIPGLIG